MTNKNKDLEDEIIAKDVEIFKMNAREKPVEDHLESDINSAGKEEQLLEARVKSLEKDLRCIKEKEASDKEKGRKLFEKK